MSPVATTTTNQCLLHAMKNTDIPVIASIKWHRLVSTMIPELDSLTKLCPQGAKFKIPRQGTFLIQPFNLREADVKSGAYYENDQGAWWITAADFTPRRPRQKSSIQELVTD